jgi:DNA-binding PadR family transcriptional regulator
MQGYEIAQQLAERSDGYFAVKEGLFYPTLHLMQRSGWLKSQWQVHWGHNEQ